MIKAVGAVAAAMLMFAVPAQAQPNPVHSSWQATCGTFDNMLGADPGRNASTVMLVVTGLVERYGITFRQAQETLSDQITFYCPQHAAAVVEAGQYMRGAIGSGG